MNIDKGRLGSTRTGLGEWLLQRLSAVYIGGYALYLLIYFSWWPIPDYPAWRAWMASGYVRLGLALFFLSLLVHSWIGMLSVYLDYAKPGWLRFIVASLTAVGLLVLGLWVADLLLQVGR